MTVKKHIWFNEQKHNVEKMFQTELTDLNGFELPSQHYKEENKKVIQDAFSYHCDSPIESNIVNIITDYCPSSSLHDCPYFWFKQQKDDVPKKYNVLKQEIVDDQIEIIGKAKYPDFIFVRQFDKNTIFIGLIRSVPFYNYIGLHYNEIYEKLLSDYQDADEYPDFSWMSTFISWLKTQPGKACSLQ